MPEGLKPCNHWNIAKGRCILPAHSPETPHKWENPERKLTPEQQELWDKARKIAQAQGARNEDQ